MSSQSFQKNDCVFSIKLSKPSLVISHDLPMSHEGGVSVMAVYRCIYLSISLAVCYMFPCPFVYMF